MKWSFKATNKKKWLLSTTAVVASAFLLTSCSSQQESKPEASTEKSQTETTTKAEKQDTEKTVKKEEKTTQENQQVVKKEEMITSSTNQYAGALLQTVNGQEPVTIAIPDPDVQMVVPVTMILSKPAASPLDAIMSIQETIKGQNYGLSDSLLKQMSYTKKGNMLVVNFKEDPTFDQGSALEMMFMKQLEYTFKPLGYKGVEFQVNGKPGVEFSHMGEVTTRDFPNEKVGYYTYTAENGKKYLVPFVPKDGNDAMGNITTYKEMLNAMKQSFEPYSLKGSIPESVTFESVVENGKNVTVTFASGTKMSNNESSVMLLDAMLLAAKEFGFETVTVKQMGLNQVGPYNVSQALPVPKAMNVVSTEK